MLNLGLGLWLWHLRLLYLRRLRLRLLDRLDIRIREPFTAETALSCGRSDEFTAVRAFDS